jgi:hypothetical protein
MTDPSKIDPRPLQPGDVVVLAHSVKYQTIIGWTEVLRSGTVVRTALGIDGSVRTRSLANGGPQFAQQLLARVVELDLLRPVDFGRPPVFDLHEGELWVMTGDRTIRHDIYALGPTVPAGLTPAQSRAREAAAELIRIIDEAAPVPR